MRCSQCGHENAETQKFCGECGTRLAVLCSRCGARNAPNQKFCGECGARITAGTSAPRSPSPDSYTPKHLAERILTSKSALEGERKQVTVLFADLKGSMELLADRDPEEARKILDPVLERMMEAVHRYEGTVNQVMGDGIMALFGAPLAHEDHAVRACYAALSLQQAVSRYAEEIHRSHGVPLQVRVGLNSGEVVVRSIGSDLKMDYTAIGQTTHLAARMEQLAVPGTILIAPETLGLIEGYVIVRALGKRPVKGLEAPIDVYELIGATGTRSRLEAAAARGLTRFVGRDGELRDLHRALERATSGQGQLVAVVGEPGVGKSRLVWEFTHAHWTQGWLVIEARSVSYGRAASYLPVIELLRAYFGIGTHDDARAVREKVTGRLLTLDRALESELSALLWLLDIPPDDAQWERLDPPQRRQRTLDAVRRLLLREARTRPVVAVFEDLHWIDAETQALLDALVESLPTARLLLLVNYRPEYRHEWSGKSYYRQLRITPLPSESAGELLRFLLGTDPALAALKRVLGERTEGNPFFIEESVRALVETGVLVGERGGYRIAGAPQSLQIPATITAIIAARIDRLTSDDKRLLQAASVIGKDVPFVLLQRIAEGDEETLRTGLSRLQAAEFLYEAQLFPELEYTFKHALTHQVAYGSLLQERRRALHSRIVEELEGLFPDRLAEQIDQIAEHARQAEVWDKAVVYLSQAGARLFGRSANREAVARFEQALVALHHLPTGKRRTEQDIDLRFQLRNALLPLGDKDGTLKHLREAERLASEAGDDRRVGWVSAYLSNCLSSHGEQSQSVACGRRALELGMAVGDADLQIMGRFFLGVAHHCGGDHRASVENFQQVVALLADRPDERFGEPGIPAQCALAFLAWGLAELGRFDEAIAHGEEAVRIAEVVDQPFTLLHGYFLGIAHLERGDLERAIPALERGFAVCRTADLHLWTSEIAADLGHAYALAGRRDEAMRVLDEALAEAVATDLRMTYARQHARIADGYLLVGRVGEAIQLAETALQAARAHGQPGQEAWALHVGAEIASVATPSDAARAEAGHRAALALAEPRGMRPLVAHCHLGLAKLYRRTGKRDQSREHLGIAMTMYREMGMTYWLEQAEPEMAELR